MMDIAKEVVLDALADWISLHLPATSGEAMRLLPLGGRRPGPREARPPLQLSV